MALEFYLTVCYVLGVPASFSDRLSEPLSPAHPLLKMPEEDLDFVVQFVLASGSLKEMARLYGVSYPTMRAALDQLIARLQQCLRGAPPDPMTHLLAALVETGDLKHSTANKIRAVHRAAIDKVAPKEEFR